jgi:hypothetical protein
MSDSVLTALRCPLDLGKLMKAGERLRAKWIIHRPKRRLQIEQMEANFLF